jgi:hypothetical protein
MRRLFAVTLLATLAVSAGACGGDDEESRAVGTGSTEAPATTAPPTSAPPDVRLTKEEFIRQGDALCADFDRKWTEIVRASDRAAPDEQIGYDEQTEAALRDMVTRFSALKAPLSDQPTAEQLNALLQQNLAKVAERLGASRAGDDEADERLVGEIENLDRQFAQATRAYGFRECPRAFGS